MNYMLITCARNEERYIEKTINSVINQTVKPSLWIIVSDGSTDKTDEIVISYVEKYSWIKLHRMPVSKDRNFGSKAICFNTGYQLIKQYHYDIIGNLDADISFEPSYFEFLIEKFNNNPNLGVAGTPFIEDGYSTTEHSFEGKNHVAGGCQLFNRRCLNEINGYMHIRTGVDWVAVTTARMKGWKTQSFEEKYFFHHRSLGTATESKLKASFSYGEKDYLLGGHPVWEFFRVLYKMKQKPYVVGGILLGVGYFASVVSCKKKYVSPELMKFHRNEQITKLKVIFLTILKGQKINKFSLGG